MRAENNLHHIADNQGRNEGSGSLKSKQTSQLKTARLQKSWTPEFVSSKVGVSLHTYTRWESGTQKPRLTSLRALCNIFGMSAEDLGFAHILAPKNTASTQEQHNNSAAYKDDDELANLAEALARWEMGLHLCWKMYNSGNRIELERVLPSYLSGLNGPTLTPGPEQKTAASLTSQVYQLIALLDLQREDFVAAQGNGTQALIYSQLAKDWNVYVAAQIRMAAIFNARKRLGSALSAYNDALHCINERPALIEPVLQSWVFAGLGEIQAVMGREKEAMQFLQLAITVFPEEPADEDTFLAYAQCDRSLLYLYEGLIFLRLGRPQQAWEAFAQVDSLKPVPSERVRSEFLKQKAYTSLALRNMIQSCIYLEAAARSAQDINSDLALSEIYTLYEHILAVWGQEPRVRLLARIFQK